MKSHTILVVEDDPNDEDLTLRALRGIPATCSVVVARSGTEALDFLLRQGKFAARLDGNPSVVFLDNTLPGVPGNELVRRIREQSDLATVPLVVFSGTSDERVIDRCLSAGANAFIEKPVDTKAYVNGLREAAEHWLALAA